MDQTLRITSLYHTASADIPCVNYGNSPRRNAAVMYDTPKYDRHAVQKRNPKSTYACRAVQNGSPSRGSTIALTLLLILVLLLLICVGFLLFCELFNTELSREIIGKIIAML